MVSGRVGRPREEGDRYPGGKLKPKTKLTRDAIAPAAWARVRSEVVAIAKDPRLASEVGRLSLHRIITDRQAVTAFRVGEIYGTYERLKGRRRSTRSPSYERGSGGEGIAEELMSDEALQDLESRIRTAEDAFLELMEILKPYPRTAVSALEQLCVEDRAIDPTYMGNMGRLLDNIAGALAASSKKRRRQKVTVAPARPRVKVISEVVTTAPMVRPAPAEKAVLEELLVKLRPDLNEEQRAEAYRIFLAMKDRHRFNEEKLATSA